MPPGWGVSPEIEARLMIAPPFPRAIIPGATRLTRRNADLRLISTILSSCSSVASSAGPFWRLVALLLTRMPIGPSARSVSRTARSSSSRFPTGQASGSTRPGRSASSPAVFSSTSSFRLAMATSAPAAASRAAMAFPMPRPPPVTRATRWASGASWLMSCSGVGTERRKDGKTDGTVDRRPLSVLPPFRLSVLASWRHCALSFRRDRLRLHQLHPRRMGPAPGGHAAHALPGRPRRAAGTQRAALHGGGGGGLPPALPPAQPARRGDPRARAGDRPVPRQDGGAEPLHPGSRGERRGGKKYHLARAPRAPRPVARSSPRGPGHHRRLPLSQPDPRRARAHGPQGIPRKLRPPAAGSLRRRSQGRRRRGVGPGVLPPGVRYPPRRGPGHPAPRPPDSRGAQRARRGRPAPRGRGKAVRLGLLRLLDLRGRRGGPHHGVVPGALPPAPGDGVPRPEVLFPQVRPPLRRGGHRLRHEGLGGDQRAQPAREHPSHPGAGPSHPREGAGPRGGAGAAEATLVLGGRS